MMPSESGSPQPAVPENGADKQTPRKAQDVNSALRRAYDCALDEAIPKSMLDLLDKLS